MSKKLLQLFLILVFTLYSIPSNTLAILDPNESCQKKKILINFDTSPPSGKNIDKLKVGVGVPFRVKVKIPNRTANNNWQYYITIRFEPVAHIPVLSGSKVLGSAPNSGTETIEGTKYRVFHWDFPSGIPSGNLGRSDFTEYRVFLEHAETTGYSDVCDGPASQIRTINSALTQVERCPLNMSDNFQSGTPVIGSVSLKTLPDIAYYYRLDPGDISSKVPLYRDNPGLGNQWVGGVGSSLLAPGPNVTLPARTGLELGKYTAIVFAATGTGGPDLTFACGVRVIEVSNDPTSAIVTSGGTKVPDDKGEPTENILSPAEGGPTTSAAGIPCGSDGILTAIGCISTNPADLIRAIVKLALGIGGGIAFLLMVFGSFQMITSAGNPETLKAGQERFRDAVIGLLFIIFAILLLRIIGVDILGLGQFFGVP